MDENIAYQNKDIISKIFAENFVGKSLKVYGLDLPKVVQVLPTNLPEVSANELRIDNLLLLEDGSVAIIDYESAYKKENRNKYINYIARVLSRYEKKGIFDISLRMIVIYTGNVTRDKIPVYYDIGALTLKIDSAFLSEVNAEEIMEKLTVKVDADEALTDEELMEFIILPLSYRENEQQISALEKSIKLAKKISDEDMMTFVLAGLVVFSDKIISEELSNQVKEWIKMTKVGRLFEEEKQAELAKREAVISQKEAELSQKEAVISQKEAELSQKDIRIRELEAQIASSRNK